MAPLAAFFAIVFSSGSCGPASTNHATRHNWWAEPSALIPDVDYERGRNAVKHKSAWVVKNFETANTPKHLIPVKSGSPACPTEALSGLEPRTRALRIGDRARISAEDAFRLAVVLDGAVAIALSLGQRGELAGMRSHDDWRI